MIEAQPNLFTSFVKVSAEEQPLYAPEDNEEVLQTLLTAKMAEYNETNVAMNLVLFQQVLLYLILKPSLSHLAARLTYQVQKPIIRMYKIKSFDFLSG